MSLGTEPIPVPVPVKTEPLPTRTKPLPAKTEPLILANGSTYLDRLTGLYDIVRSLNSIIQLDKLLNQIIASATEMMDARGGALLLSDSEGKNLKFEVVTGGASSQLRGMVISVNDRSIAGLVATRGKPFIENNAQRSSHFSGEVDKLTGYKTRKLICVPLKVQERITGVIEVLDKVSGEDFNREDVKLLEALADVAAVAIENVRLYEQANQRTRQLERAYDELHRTCQGTLLALTGLLDARDSSTKGHSSRVVAYTSRLARELGITDPEELRALEQGALLHDVGKIGIADAILRKPGPLDAAEWTEMRSHPVLGYKMLKDIEFLQDALPVVRYHHERWDGNGYPHGLKGMAIPLGARIFAVADAFDAITSERPYSKARTYEQAKAIITKESGNAFDPTVVRAFLKVAEDEWQQIRGTIGT
jgi:putative nucleotidyltransferase with HDIG domain